MKFGAKLRPLPGLPGQRRHRRVHLPGDRPVRRGVARHGPGCGGQPGCAAAAAGGARRLLTSRARPGPRPSTYSPTTCWPPATGPTVELVDPPDGVSLESDSGPVVIEAPDKADGRNVEVVYRPRQRHRRSSQGTITAAHHQALQQPAGRVRRVRPAPTRATRSPSIPLETAYDPDGPSGPAQDRRGVRAAGRDRETGRGQQDHRSPAASSRSSCRSGSRTPTAVRRPRRCPCPLGSPAVHEVPHAPPRGRARRLGHRQDPSLRPGHQPARRPGDPDPEEPDLGLPDDLADRASDRRGHVQGDRGRGLRRPGRGDLRGHHRQLGRRRQGQKRRCSPYPCRSARPRPSCAARTKPVEIAQGESVDLDIAALCHVWTADPEDADSLKFAADWGEAGQRTEHHPARKGAVIEVAAAGSAKPGTQGTLKVQSGGSEPGLIRFTVISSRRRRRRWRRSRSRT